MKTSELIDMLARQAGAAAPHAAALTFLPVIAVGVLLGAMLSAVSFGALPASIWATATPWIKVAYGATLALAAGWLCVRLARPLSDVRGPLTSTLLVIGAMALVGLAWWMATPEAAREAALMGRSWYYCPTRVAVVSMPTLVGMLWAMRNLAPTRPRAAGFAAGLVAGAVGVCAYAVSCGESSPTFIAVWYTIGALAPAVLGALVGPKVLRW